MLDKIDGLPQRFFAKNQERKERKLIQDLPPVYFRLFGDVNYQDQLKGFPEIFKEKVVILTTHDTPKKIVEEMNEKHWNVLQSDTVTDEEAKSNSSSLLNEAILDARKNGSEYMFFLSSGFQRFLGTFYSIFTEIREKHPQKDCYYFLLPETHTNVSHSQQLNTNDIKRFLTSFFPSETALIFKPSTFFLEEELSKKGNLGQTQQGIPMGGMEFFMTLLTEFSYHNKKGENFSPEMVGITLPMLTRANEGLPDWYIEVGELPPESKIDLKTPSLEVTSFYDKQSRKAETIRAAMEKLQITDDNIRELFSDLVIEPGITSAFKYWSSYAPVV